MSELENIYHLIVQEFPSRGICALLVGGHAVVLFCMKPEAALRIDFLKTDSPTMMTLWEKRNPHEL